MRSFTAKCQQLIWSAFPEAAHSESTMVQTSVKLCAFAPQGPVDEMVPALTILTVIAMVRTPLLSDSEEELLEERDSTWWLEKQPSDWTLIRLFVVVPFL
jgi:hypothetical protein